MTGVTIGKDGIVDIMVWQDRKEGVNASKRDTEEKQRWVGVYNYKKFKVDDGREKRTVRELSSTGCLRILQLLERRDLLVEGGH